MTIIVTGGAGFIGSALVHYLISVRRVKVVCIDKLTYAANLASLKTFTDNPDFFFEQTDICSADEIKRIFKQHRPSGIMHLAAESHVDRSIDSPGQFIQTNIVGTYTLLGAALEYWEDLDGPARESFRFLHVSTDEVYGSLGADGLFTEDMPYRPNSPYAASKASSDLLARAWHKTYGLPVVISNCSNNYGPRQFPEKLIPLMIIKGMSGESLPVYGTGMNVRDWLHVDDHAEALTMILEKGRPGQTYNIGGNAERNNMQVVETICAELDKALPDSPHRPHRQLVKMVADRPGHDLRYAMDYSKLAAELGWQPKHTFEQGLADTVRWYLDNHWWWQPIIDGTYAGQRLGLNRRD